MNGWEGLNPPYSTIVADPPWAYDEGWTRFGDRAGVEHVRTPLPYSSMGLDDISKLPGPYVELFARQPRLGWDAWGLGHESGAA